MYSAHKLAPGETWWAPTSYLQVTTSYLWLSAGALDTIAIAAQNVHARRMTWRVIRNDEYPAITYVIVDEAGHPVDLSGAAAVMFQMALAGQRAKVDAPCAIVSAAGGAVRYDWRTDDLDTAGDFLAAFKVEFADGRTRTYPPPPELLHVVVAPDIPEVSPRVLSVTPSSGTRAGAVPIVITGRNLNGATGVTVGGQQATSVVVVDRHTIHAITPFSSAGGKKITVVVPGGNASNAVAYTAIGAPPTLGSVSPASGEISSGATITIHGTLLDAATSVTVGGIACTSVVVVSPSQVTAVLPVLPAGALDVVVTTTDGSGTLPAAYTAFYDPALLVLSGWWRAAYSGAPWVGSASAGASSGANLQAGSAPTVGASQNGFAPAAFDGSTKFLVNPSALSTFFAGASGSVAILFEATSAAADNAQNAYANPSFITDANAYMGLGFSNAGVRATIYDGAYKQLTVAASVGAYHLAQMKWDGSTLSCRVDGGAWSSVSAGAIPVLTNTPIVGKTYNAGAFFAGTILEIICSQATLSDANFEYLRHYANARYALSL